MLHHPTTIHAAADLRRRELLATAEREHANAVALGQTWHPRISPQRWVVAATVAALLVLVGLVADPGALGAPTDPRADYTRQEEVSLEMAGRPVEAWATYDRLELLQ